MIRAIFSPLSIILAVVAGTTVGIQPPHVGDVTLFAALAFLTFAPGAALIDLFLTHTVQWATAIVIAVALSASLDVATAQTMVWSRLWYPRGAVVILAGLTLVIATLAEVKHSTRPHAVAATTRDNGVEAHS